ncbi:carboxypeptidase regulatory-like domain-containing protein [candidate division WOR-3 bacterium]|nr:carboxypeptidase regulatory-like domain-containing protein [candidate division WOR-3 bacterium]
MKRMLVLLTVVAAGMAIAYPGIGGGRGLFRVQNALVQDDAGLTISFNVLGRNPTYSVPEDADEKGWVADLIAPELNYAPLATKWVGAELFASWGGIFQYPLPPDPSDKKFGWGLHDLKAGAKLSIPIVPVLKLGAILDYTFIERENKQWLDPGAVPTTDGLGWKALATLRLQDLASSLPNVMVNYSQADRVTTYGAGVELAATGFALFAEAQSIQPDAVSTGIFDTNNGIVRLTPGVAFGTGTSGATLKAGYTFAWGPTAVNEALLGLVIATPFGKRTPPEFGTIAGRVVDKRTGNGIVASVSFPENPKLTPMTTDQNGVFTIDRVGVGVVVVEVAADGYGSQAMPVNVAANTVAQYEFELRPLVTYGTIAGIVTDGNTNGPLAAMVGFPGTDVSGVESEAATGSFRVDNVPVGVYTVTAEADGYFKASLTVQVEEGRVATPSFALKPLTETTTLTGKVSDKKSGDPLAAEVSFPDAGLAAVSTDPATGVYKAELPVGSYAVKVASEGYLDQTAAIVLQKDKPLIRDFELVKEGMAITLRGIYFDVNKATIKPESHPALEGAAKILNENPGIRVEIQGHTDSDGSDTYNQQLSERRAQSVVTYLVQNFAIGAARLTARGYGESQPVASNSTPEGKALNRRVEFVILKSGE